MATPALELVHTDVFGKVKHPSVSGMLNMLMIDYFDFHL